MNSDDSFELNLAAYFARISFTGDPRPNLATLRELQRAHATHIPFENVDVFLGRRIRLDLPSLEAKLVNAKRGGYCFEQNGLFSTILERLGFSVTRLIARVHLGTKRINPRTHMLNLVQTESGPHIADVGFGGWGLIEPIPFVAGQVFRQGAWSYRLEQRGEGLWMLQAPQCPLGEDLYSFSLDPQLPVDYEAPNHYTSTHPDSRFVQVLVAQIPSLDRRVFLRNRELITVTGNGMQTELLPDDRSVIAALEKHFGLQLPADTTSVWQWCSRACARRGR